MSQRRKESHREFILRMVKQYPKEFRSDKSVLYCIICDCVVNAEKISQVTQHVGGKTHRELVERKKNKSASATQTLVTSYQNTPGPKLSEFNMDLCKMMLEANIPLNKVAHPSVVTFIEKHTKHSAPNQSTLRKNYVSHLHEGMLKELQSKADGKQIWVTLDETTDVEQRMVANFVFGILGDENERGKSYLLNVAQLEKTNANTIAAFFTDSLLVLWPKGKFF